MRRTTRRNFLVRTGASLSTLLLAGCYDLSRQKWAVSILEEVEHLTRRAQLLFAGNHALAPEFEKKDIAPVFRGNGTLAPGTAEYATSLAYDFSDWRVTVDGLVEKPLSLSIAELEALANRTQITRHDCVEGWSCIGEWTGAPLKLVLAMAKPKQDARYVVFHCADPMGADGPFYYESLDLLEAMHPQTLLATRLNGEKLPVQNGAPVRLRAERKLGYKMAKYVKRIELVADYSHIEGGRGGYWEDRGYDWYGGI